MSDKNQLSQDSLFDDDFKAPEQGANRVSANGTKASRRAKTPLSSREQLNATIKSVRDLLRKDAGLAGDTDRLPQLTWLLFLKNLDDFEISQEDELGEAYVPVIEAPYRWSDWAAVEDKTQRLTGDELLDFVNNDLIPYWHASPVPASTISARLSARSSRAPTTACVRATFCARW